jgi:hypothetical protein
MMHSAATRFPQLLDLRVREPSAIGGSGDRDGSLLLLDGVRLASSRQSENLVTENGRWLFRGHGIFIRR